MGCTLLPYRASGQQGLEQIMTAITITIENAKSVIITDEHAASSYGIPVAVVDGEAYGPADNLPIWPADDLSWLVEPARTTIAAAVGEMKRAGNGLSESDSEFVSRFWNV
jgi:hypothetical protein